MINMFFFCPRFMLLRGAFLSSARFMSSYAQKQSSNFKSFSMHASYPINRSRIKPFQWPFTILQLVKLTSICSNLLSTWFSGRFSMESSEALSRPSSSTCQSKIEKIPQVTITGSCHPCMTTIQLDIHWAALILVCQFLPFSPCFLESWTK